jgi:hypothetical protein
MSDIKKLVITGPERVLESIQALIYAIWEADHKYEMLDELECELITMEEK